MFVCCNGKTKLWLNITLMSPHSFLGPNADVFPSAGYPAVAVFPWASSPFFLCVPPSASPRAPLCHRHSGHGITLGQRTAVTQVVLVTKLHRHHCHVRDIDVVVMRVTVLVAELGRSGVRKVTYNYMKLERKWNYYDKSTRQPPCTIATLFGPIWNDFKSI